MPGPVASTEALVYGNDDRVDLYQASEPFAQLARDTAVAFISPDLLRRQDAGTYAIDAPTYGDVQSLCPGERFSEQLAAASCSGVLVAPDIVATAGHCLGVAPDGGADCTFNRYVLGFAISDPATSITLIADRVFECSGVVARIAAPSDSRCRFDVALLKLDRPAASNAALAPLRAQPVETGEAVVVIGFTAGLPVKIDEGARVIDARLDQGDYFTLNSDTFAVSSGSGVLDGQGRLVGLFSRGRQDYDLDGDCQRVRREDESKSSGFEEATGIAAVRQMLAVTHGERAEPLDGQTCRPLDYVQKGQGPADGSARADRSGTCTTTNIGTRSDRASFGTSCWILALALVVVWRKGTTARRSRCRAPVQALSRAWTGLTPTSSDASG